jgi:hypothetical protein
VIYPCNGILLSLKRKKLLPGTVSMSIVPATKKAEIRRLEVLRLAQVKKVNKTPSQPIS